MKSHSFIPVKLETESSRENTRNSSLFRNCCIAGGDPKISLSLLGCTSSNDTVVKDSGVTHGQYSLCDSEEFGETFHTQCSTVLTPSTTEPMRTPRGLIFFCTHYSYKNLAICFDLFWYFAIFRNTLKKYNGLNTSCKQCNILRKFV